jgi:hypothetical protein
MRTVNKYFSNRDKQGKQNILKLTKIVKIVDENIDEETEWQKDNGG